MLRLGSLLCKRCWDGVVEVDTRNPDRTYQTRIHAETANRATFYVSQFSVDLRRTKICFLLTIYVITELYQYPHQTLRQQLAPVSFVPCIRIPFLRHVTT